MSLRSQIYRFIGLWATLIVVLSALLLAACLRHPIYLVFILLILVGIISCAFWAIAGGWRKLVDKA